MYNTIGGVTCLFCASLVKYIPISEPLQILFVIALGFTAAVLHSKIRNHG